MEKPAKLPETLVGWLESLADRTRLRLMRILEQQELGVVELCEILQLPQSTVSRHLKLLADQGWIHHRRDGTTRLYRMILEELQPAAKKLWLLAREQTDAWATIRQDDLRLARRLQHRQVSSQAFFAGAAGKWDKLRKDLYGESFTTAALLALLPSDYIVADLGCGTGQVAAILADHVKHVYAIDNSAPMLKAAQKRIGQRSNVELLSAQLDQIPLGAGICDAALLLLVLTYAPDPAPIVREAARILKPQGKLILVDLLPHDRQDFRRQMGQLHLGFPAEQITDLLKQQNLTHIQVRSLSPEPHVKGPALFLATGTKPCLP